MNGQALPPSRVAIIVLNWNGREDSLRCLESLADYGAGCTVIFVDNASTDGSVQAVRGFDSSMIILENDGNLGFSKGNNVGLSHALLIGADVIGILNNDTVVTPGFLTPLLDSIGDGSDPVFVSPEIRYLGEPSTVWFAGADVSPSTGIFVHEKLDPAASPGVRPTPMATGCALFAHRSTWQRVGPLDERYFLIFEDADWSARATSLGCRGLVVNGSHIFHAVSATIDRQGTAGEYYYTRNGLLFLRTHRGSSGQLMARFLAERFRTSLREARHRKWRTAFTSALLNGWGALDAARGHWGRFDPTGHPAEILRRFQDAG